MKVLACDTGTRRHGFALSDSKGLFVVRTWTAEAGEKPEKPILESAKREGLSEVVLGLPLTMSGTESDQSVWVRALGKSIEEGGVGVCWVDERLTTPAGVRGPKRDEWAAATILEIALQQRRGVRGG
ncbi:RuvX/YqgF family protein [bacterium]|nr:RuvX/YqgF family protein [bacterium]